VYTTWIRVGQRHVPQTAGILQREMAPATSAAKPTFGLPERKAALCSPHHEHIVVTLTFLGYLYPEAFGCVKIKIKLPLVLLT